ncbi:hypothetical protein G6038_09500 [Rhodococcus sp. 14C212]|uniref:hypothetical protein n=1 Tax=Rhodococcus sp. 14C212 TaxID=2711209 RepID=UPI0013EAEAC2|nr:hypothetical protein [Rhodococcus sp. 14C212]NGP05713.1 hypothetical protein [Rhodococcus sp. 14C212]
MTTTAQRARPPRPHRRLCTVDMVTAFVLLIGVQSAAATGDRIEVVVGGDDRGFGRGFYTVMMVFFVAGCVALLTALVGRWLTMWAFGATGAAVVWVFAFCKEIGA